MNQLINLKETQEQLKVAVKTFRAHEDQISAHVQCVSSLPKVADKESRDIAHKVLSEASRSIREFEKLRKDTTRPLDDLKKNVMTHQKGVILPLEEKMKLVEAQIVAFDQEQERIRLEELAKIEAERQAREEAERKERERVWKLKSQLAELESRFTNSITSATSTDTLNNIAEGIKIELNAVDRFEEFEEEARAILSRMIDQGKTKRTQILEFERLEAERKKAEAENSKAQAELIAAKQKQAEERARIQREQEEIERQRIANERAKAEAEAEAQRLEQEKVRREAEQKRLKALKAARAKGIQSGIDEIKIVNLQDVPTHLYEVKFNLNEVKKDLKQGDIPGLEISFKSGLRLNG